MRSRAVIIGEVQTQQALEVRRVEHDEVIEALAADGPDQAFDVRILPGRARGDAHLVDTEAFHTAPESFAVYIVTVTQQEPGSGVEGKRLEYLLCRALDGRVLGDVEVDNLAPLMPEHQEHLQFTKGGCGDGEEVDGHERVVPVDVRDPLTTG